MKAIKEYVWNLFVIADQLVNTVTGGKPDCTVSACAYAYSNEDDFWDVLREIIDFAFFPIHGEGHCKQAFDKDNENYNRGGLLRKSAIAIVTIPFCMLLSLVLWPLYTVKEIF